jgi:hypothetical protein
MCLNIEPGMIDVCKVGIWADNRILASIQLLFLLDLFIATVLRLPYRNEREPNLFRIFS